MATLVVNNGPYSQANLDGAYPGQLQSVRDYQVGGLLTKYSGDRMRDTLLGPPQYPGTNNGNLTTFRDTEPVANYLLPDAYRGAKSYLKSVVVMGLARSLENDHLARYAPLVHWPGCGQVVLEEHRYHPGTLDRVPEQGVATTMTTSWRRRTFFVSRYAKGLQMENGFAATPQGVEDYLHRITQILITVRDQMNLNALWALLNAQRYISDEIAEYRAQGFIFQHQTLDKVWDAEVDAFGKLSRSPNASNLPMIFSSIRTQLNSQGGEGASTSTSGTMLLLPAGVKEMIGLNYLDQYNYSRGGPRDVAVGESRDLVAIRANQEGFQLIPIGNYPIESGMVPRCPLISLRVVGCAYAMEKSRLWPQNKPVPNGFDSTDMRIGIYDWNAEQLRWVSYEDTLRAAGWFDAEGNPVEYFLRAFAEAAGVVTWHDYAVKYGSPIPNVRQPTAEDLARRRHEARRIEQNDDGEAARARFFQTPADFAARNTPFYKKVRDSVGQIFRESLPDIYQIIGESAMRFFSEVAVFRVQNGEDETRMLNLAMNAARKLADALLDEDLKRDRQKYGYAVETIRAFMETFANPAVPQNDDWLVAVGQLFTDADTAISLATLEACTESSRPEEAGIGLRRLPVDAPLWTVNLSEYKHLVFNVQAIPPVSFLILRPNMTFTMGSMIAVQPGSATTVLGSVNWMLGTEPSQKTMYGHLSLYTNCMIVNPRGIVVQPNATYHAYVSGGSTLFFDPHNGRDVDLNRKQKHLLRQVKQSMYAIPLVGKESASSYKNLNITGRDISSLPLIAGTSLADDVPTGPRMMPFYAQFWEFTQASSIGLFDDFTDQERLTSVIVRMDSSYMHLESQDKDAYDHQSGYWPWVHYNGMSQQIFNSGAGGYPKTNIQVTDAIKTIASVPSNFPAVRYEPIARAAPLQLF